MPWMLNSGRSSDTGYSLFPTSLPHIAPTRSSSVDPSLRFSTVRPLIESESRFNIRIYRNVSLDLKLTAAYERKDERTRQDWIVYGLDSFLRISLYY